VVAEFQDLGLIAVGVLFGAFVLLVGAVSFALPRFISGRAPGSRGHRPPEQEASQQQQKGETVAPDGYIDTFANVIEEAGGGLPTIVWVAIIGVGLWWLAYMILFWNG
jgi:hypothetical protein